MSGKIVVHPTPPTLKKHDHVIITFDDNYHLTFNDPRRFGIVTYDKTNTINDHDLLKKLGPEPLTETFDGHYLHHVLSSKKAAIKTTIMDSHVIVGVGNIYAAESLFRSRISPTKVSNTLTQKECETLCQQIKEVLRDAITSGGSTLRDYVRSSGDSGYFQHHFQVYGRENEPCFQCQNPIKKIRQTGRSTYYCPQCQK
jgi:formamidopyrimidine-DNA glycosylase